MGRSRGRGRGRDGDRKDPFAHYARYGQQTDNQKETDRKQQQAETTSHTQNSTDQSRSASQTAQQYTQIEDMSPAETGQLKPPTLEQPNTAQEQQSTSALEHPAYENAKQKVEQTTSSEQREGISRSAQVFARYARSPEPEQEKQQERGQEHED